MPARGVWGHALPGKFWISDFLRDHSGVFLGNLEVKLQKLDDLLLNLFVVFEARRIKGVTLLRAAEAAKQLVIRIRHGKISALIIILIAFRHP